MEWALPNATCDRVYATTGYEQSVSRLSELSLANDIVFGDCGGVSQVGTVSGSVDDGYVVTLTVRVDTSSA